MTSYLDALMKNVDSNPIQSSPKLEPQKIKSPNQLFYDRFNNWVNSYEEAEKQLSKDYDILFPGYHTCLNCHVYTNEIKSCLWIKGHKLCLECLDQCRLCNSFYSKNTNSNFSCLKCCDFESLYHLFKKDELTSDFYTKAIQCSKCQLMTCTHCIAIAESESIGEKNIDKYYCKNCVNVQLIM